MIEATRTGQLPVMGGENECSIALVLAEPQPNFAAIYDTYFDFVWATLRRLGVATANLDDAAQDVFVTLYRRLGDYDGRAPMKSWLFGIVNLVASDYRRRFLRKESKCVPPPADSQEDVVMESTRASPAAAAEHAEKVAQLERILDQLDDNKRAMLVLFHLEQMTMPEIARALGINLSTAYSRLRAARQAFDEACAADLAPQRGEAP
jgi:RNA polymerase sigma-70 factor, ECF subfamily